jgi:hypothetical protein
MDTTNEKIKVVKEQLAVMQAFVDGKKVQVRTKSPGNKWQELKVNCPSWQWDVVEYRIKPEPEVVYISKSKYGSFYAHTDYESAVAGAGMSATSYQYVGKKFVAVEE